MTTTLLWTSYAALWALTLVLAAAVFLLLRHHGQVAMGKGADRATQGPEVGKPLPTVRLQTSQGTTVEFGTAVAGPSLVLVAGATCRACDRAIAGLDNLITTQHAAVALVCLGDADACRTVGKVLPANVVRVLDPKHRVVARWNVTSTPFICAIDKKGIVRGKTSASRREALEALWRDVTDGSTDGMQQLADTRVLDEGLTFAANPEGGQYATDSQ